MEIIFTIGLHLNMSSNKIENIRYKNKKEFVKRVIDMLKGDFSLVINGSEDIFEE